MHKIVESILKKIFFLYISVRYIIFQFTKIRKCIILNYLHFYKNTDRMFWYKNIIYMKHYISCKHLIFAIQENEILK